MPFFGLVWVTSWVSCFLSCSQGLWRVPDYLVSTFPTKVFSVINSPIELPTPIVPTQLYSGVWSANSSVATLPNLAFKMNGAPSPSRFQPIQSIFRPPVRPKAEENAFCHPELEPKVDSLLMASLSNPSSAAWEESPREVSKATFSQQIRQVMQNLLPWRQRTESVEQLAAKSIVVISTHSGEPVSNQQSSEVPRVKRGFWQYSQQVVKRAVAAPSHRQEERFQVWMKKRLIAQFPNQLQADLMAQRLKQFLSEPSDHDLKAMPVEAALVDGLPTVKIGDRILFKVDDAIAEALKRNPELIAIEWANNLRIALGKTRLPLAEAQKQMYNLVETPRTFKGRASWYGPTFHGRLTATGETYNQHELTAAHPSLPFDTYLKVRNLKNGNSVIVRINDRGPYVHDRALDLSREAARCINSEKVGIVPFEAVIMQPSSMELDRYISRN